MMIYTLVFCWNVDGTVSTYCYSSLEKAVQSAAAVMVSCVLKHGGLVQKGKAISLDTFISLLTTYKWYENSGEDYFWVRIDENELDK